MMKLFKVLGMVVACYACSSCMNMYVRCPATDEKIIGTYQCTKEAFALSCVVMFPQILSPGNTKDFYVENLITVPIGCLCFVDVACEGVLDTVLWPIDLSLSRKRAN